MKKTIVHVDNFLESTMRHICVAHVREQITDDEGFDYKFLLVDHRDQGKVMIMSHAGGPEHYQMRSSAMIPNAHIVVAGRFLYTQHSCNRTWSTNQIWKRVGLEVGLI